MTAQQTYPDNGELDVEAYEDWPAGMTWAEAEATFGPLADLPAPVAVLSEQDIARSYAAKAREALAYAREFREVRCFGAAATFLNLAGTWRRAANAVAHA